VPEFRPGELSQWVSRLWKNGMPDDPVTGISNDTRTIQPGNLYIALLYIRPLKGGRAVHW